MRDEVVSREELTASIVTDTRISTGMLKVPPSYVEHLEQPERVDFLDFLQVELKHLDETVHKGVFFWSEAMDLYESLDSWLTSQHTMGRCGCSQHDEPSE